MSMVSNPSLPANPLCVTEDTCFTLVGDVLTLTVHGVTVHSWEAAEVEDLLTTEAGDPLTTEDGIELELE